MTALVRGLWRAFPAEAGKELRVVNYHANIRRQDIDGVELLGGCAPGVPPDSVAIEA